MKKIKFLIILLFLTSCSFSFIKTNELEDGMTDVPFNKDFFDKRYREKHEVINLNQVDFNAIYIESYSISDNGIFDLRSGSNDFINGIKFYTNGCVSVFGIDKNKINDQRLLNPIVHGFRGMSYVKKKDTLIDFYAPANSSYQFGKIKHKARVNGDTLFLTDRYDIIDVYLKKQLTEKNLGFEADW